MSSPANFDTGSRQEPSPGAVPAPGLRSSAALTWWGPRLRSGRVGGVLLWSATATTWSARLTGTAAQGGHLGQWFRGHRRRSAPVTAWSAGVNDHVSGDGCALLSGHYVVDSSWTSGGSTSAGPSPGQRHHARRSTTPWGRLHQQQLLQFGHQRSCRQQGVVALAPPFRRHQPILEQEPWRVAWGGTTGLIGDIAATPGWQGQSQATSSATTE